MPSTDLAYYGADPTGKRDSTMAIENWIANAVAQGNTVAFTAGAGTYIISQNLKLAGPCKLVGAGNPDCTIIQTVRQGIFSNSKGHRGIKISGFFLDTGTHNTTYPPLPNDPDPPVLYSVGSHCSFTNCGGKTGTGYGMRVVGNSSAPCYNQPCSHNTVADWTMENYGTGGYASFDISCQAYTTVSNLVVNPGGSVAFYRDANCSLNGLTYTANQYQIQCAPCIQVNSDPLNPSHDLSFTNITSNAGPIRLVGAGVTNLTIDQTVLNTNCPSS